MKLMFHVMKITLDIPENKYQFFLELIKSLNFITVEDRELTIPEWQKKIVRDRIKNTKPEDYLSWEEVEKQFKFDQ